MHHCQRDAGRHTAFCQGRLPPLIFSTEPASTVLVYRQSGCGRSCPVEYQQPDGFPGLSQSTVAVHEDMPPRISVSCVIIVLILKEKRFRPLTVECGSPVPVIRAPRQRHFRFTILHHKLQCIRTGSKQIKLSQAITDACSSLLVPLVRR